MEEPKDDKEASEDMKRRTGRWRRSEFKLLDRMATDSCTESGDGC